jgi:hypothetical protein
MTWTGYGGTECLLPTRPRIHVCMGTNGRHCYNRRMKSRDLQHLTVYVVAICGHPQARSYCTSIHNEINYSLSLLACSLNIYLSQCGFCNSSLTTTLVLYVYAVPAPTTLWLELRPSERSRHSLTWTLLIGEQTSSIHPLSHRLICYLFRWSLRNLFCELKTLQDMWSLDPPRDTLIASHNTPHTWLPGSQTPKHQTHSSWLPSRTPCHSLTVQSSCISESSALISWICALIIYTLYRFWLRWNRKWGPAIDPDPHPLEHRWSAIAIHLSSLISSIASSFISSVDLVIYFISQNVARNMVSSPSTRQSRSCIVISDTLDYADHFANRACNSQTHSSRLLQERQTLLPQHDLPLWSDLRADRIHMYTRAFDFRLPSF